MGCNTVTAMQLSIKYWSLEFRVRLAAYKQGQVNLDSQMLWNC